MIVRYHARDSSFPSLRKRRPHISETDRKLARLDRPPALPLHCRPWLDAESYGMIVPFPYNLTLTIRGLGGGKVEFDVSDRVGTMPEGELVREFAEGYVSIVSGYTFLTDPPIGLYTIGLAGSPGAALHVHGLLETWWYPRPLFAVYRVPQEGEELRFAPGDALCVALPVVCEAAEIVKLDAEDAADLVRAEKQYEQERRTRIDLMWTSAEGDGFSRLYKEKARVHRVRRRRSD